MMDMFALLKIHKIIGRLGREYDFHPLLTGIEIRRRMFRAEEKVLLEQFVGGSIERPYQANQLLAKAA